jgi:hypothetical protein
MECLFVFDVMVNGFHKKMPMTCCRENNNGPSHSRANKPSVKISEEDISSFSRWNSQIFSWEE